MSEVKEGTELGCSLGTGHVPAEEMSRYVQGQLAAQERERIELRLERCGHCLQLFMAALDASAEEDGADSIFMQPVMNDLETRVIEQLAVEARLEVRSSQPPVGPEMQSGRKSSAAVSVQEKPYRRRSWLQHPVTHYTIAASVTLLLLGSGTFASFSQKLAEHDIQLMASEERSQPPHQPPAAPANVESRTVSWSDKMVNQTGTWLDGLQALRFK
ncbi:hypothetical protein KP806_24725 [Paenibacillus sp. N4]|uniref:hypothetical protein n=1 Tax=Paenibacillus vietnamensis TaxID=2590547 RepID=UPI001CD09944|nr:hypothetical protein [Paenibacillus vietnamensis]MCA0758264.1 hypothetical protein [Paenibacillus vietnamensis]